jgi:predicted nucleotidyltransferase
LSWASTGRARVAVTVAVATNPSQDRVKDKNSHGRKRKMVEACHSIMLYFFVMKRDESISRLKQHEAELKRLGVERLFMFGSTVRGEANEESDVDLFFDYEKGKLGVFELMDVKEYAASILGRRADIMTRDSLHKTLRRQIEETAIRVF